MGLNWARVGRIVALRMDRMVGGREGRPEGEEDWLRVYKRLGWGFESNLR